MNAKDIVAKEVARQRDFGYEPSWEDFAIAGRRVGIEEVVEWVNGNLAYELINTQRLVCNTPDKRAGLSYQEKALSICLVEWQAKLKEWG